MNVNNTITTTEKKGYLRCCISCRQPWTCQPDTVGDLNTYMCYGMQSLCSRVNVAGRNRSIQYFSSPVQNCHVFQKAHQEPALLWIVDTNYDFTTANGVHSATFNASDWNGSRTFGYRGEWARPDPGPHGNVIQHRGILHFFNRLGNNLDNTVQVPFTVFGCEKCNQVMDSRAKLRITLLGRIVNRCCYNGVIPANAITMTTRLRDGTFGYPHVIPNSHANVIGTSPLYASMRLGVYCAYYLHSSFMYLYRHCDFTGRKLPCFNGKRNVAAALTFLALHVFLKWFDLQSPQPSNRKPSYTFKGLLNLYISLHQYVCLRAEYPQLQLSFPAFHTFYFLEMAQCKVPGFWNTAEHKFPHNKVFARVDINRPKKELIEKVSNRLMDLYKFHTRAVIIDVIETWQKS
jgi:hypothetical protein